MPRIDTHRRAIEARLEALAEPVAHGVLAALDDPSRRAWVQGVVAVLARLDPTQVAELHETVLVLHDGVRVALAEGPGDPAPSRVLAELDRVFTGDGWMLRLRRALPDRVDLAPIQQSIRLWLTARTMERDPPATVTYDHDDVSMEFTLLEPLGGGHRVTVGPRVRPPLEGLDEAVEHCPQAPVVAIRTGERFGRHAVLSALYGTARTVSATSGPNATLEAEIGRGGWFARHEQVAEVWWIHPHPAPFGTLWRCASPWATTTAHVASDRHAEARADDAEHATLRWTQRRD